MRKEISSFFHHFAMHIMLLEHADPNNPKSIKMSMLNHYEEIYPAFAQTKVFKENNGREGHDKMVELYKEFFSMLLMGKIPQPEE